MAMYVVATARYLVTVNNGTDELVPSCQSDAWHIYVVAWTNLWGQASQWNEYSCCSVKVFDSS